MENDLNTNDTPISEEMPAESKKPQSSGCLHFDSLSSSDFQRGRNPFHVWRDHSGGEQGDDDLLR